MRFVRALIVAAVCGVTSVGLAARQPAPERVQANDNRVPAGILTNGVLTIAIDARQAEWHPDADADPGAEVGAFAERGHGAQIPGPLVRVMAGTEVVATVRNQFAHDTLVIHGLHTRPGVDQPFSLLPNEERTVRFRLDAAGTYYYYGSTTGRIVDFRVHEDAQLSGAIVVDDANAPKRNDRIMVIGMWTDTVARAYTKRNRLLAVINGRSWPNTEHLTATVGDTITWRVINASADAHPMHLHGFYFRVDSRGDGTSDTVFRKDARDLAVTEGLNIGSTMKITWVPEREGNWLFHCHIPEHFAHRAPLGQPLAASATLHAADHATGGMGGLVMGIAVKPGAGVRSVAAVPENARRQMRLLVRANKGSTKEQPYFAFSVPLDQAVTGADSGLAMGPPLVLTRGQPVSITVVNTLSEPTAVHWHGIELESYFDGVAGFSGDAKRLSPVIAPRDSFVARFTPPRSGTFIYHTHMDEERQQPAGLAGPIIVIEPGTRYDASTDKTVIISSPWEFSDQQRGVMLNGSMTPAPLELQSGVTYRLRFINMTLRRPALRVDFRRDTTYLQWRNLAKDGADLPVAQQVPAIARHGIAIGETFDVEFTPTEPGPLRLEVRIGGRQAMGPIMGVMPVRVVR